MRRLTSARRILAMCLLAALCLAIAACGTAGEQKDTGPNANLTNEELISTATTNMKGMESYHFEYQGGIPSDSIRMSPNFSMEGDLQFNGKGSRVRMGDNAQDTGQPDPNGVTLFSGNSLEMLIVEGSRPYLSYDGGKTWETYGVDTGADYLMAIFGWLWVPPKTQNASLEEEKASGENVIAGLTFVDGDPRLEEIDGTVTRHVVADVPERAVDPIMGFEGFLTEGASKVSLWVSTDVTPTIRQMQIEGSKSVPQNEISGIKSVAYSPDGKMVASAHEDGTIRIWDMSKQKGAPRVLSSGWGQPSSVAFSPDGKTLAAAIYSGGPPSEVRLWDTGNFDSKPITLSTQSSVSEVAFRPDGKQLAAACGGGAYLWDIPFAGAEPTFISYPGNNVVNSLAYSPNGTRLATGNLNAGVGIHDVANPQSILTRLEHEWVNKVAFHPGGNLLASIGGFPGEKDQGVKLWDLRQPKPTPVTLPANTSSGETVAFSPDGKIMATTGQGSDILLWSLQSDAIQGEAHRLPAAEGVVYAIAFSPDGEWLASGNSEGELRLWKVQDPGAMAGSTPIILKEDEQWTDTAYTLKWKWSRFNEDFGTVEPPPTDTIE